MRSSYYVAGTIKQKRSGVTVWLVFRNPVILYFAEGIELSAILILRYMGHILTLPSLSSCINEDLALAGEVITESKFG